jgi:transposase-like protein
MNKKYIYLFILYIYGDIMSVEVKEVKEEKKVCKYCGSIRVNKLGFVPTVKGKKRRYICRDCGHTFY